VTRIIEIAPRDVVFVKSIVEASEGVASIFAEAGGLLHVATPASRLGALDALLDDLAQEVALARVPCPMLAARVGSA